MPVSDTGRVSLLLAAVVLALAQSPARAQFWSSPDFVVRGFDLWAAPAQLVKAPGDTFWVLNMAGDSLLAAPQVRAYWSAGDSWHGPTVLSPDSMLNPFLVRIGQASLDPQGRIWVAWGTAIPDMWPPYYWNGTISYAVHDSSGWHSPDSCLIGNCQPWGMTFAPDRAGEWYMGFSLDFGYGTTSYTESGYQKWLGNRWSGVEQIGGSALMAGYLAPALAPDPTGGLWAVLGYYDAHTSESQVYRLPADPDTPRFRLPSSFYAVATDSAGRVWITYLNGTELRWLGIEHEQVVDSGLVYSPAHGNVLTAVDPQGVVWTVWNQGPAIWASYDQGLGWTQPEVVADSASSLDCIAFDGEGLPHVAFRRTSGDAFALYVTRRLSHVAETENRPRPISMPSVQLLSPNPSAGDVRILLRTGAKTKVSLRVFSISGRAVRTLVRGIVEPGCHSVRWDARAEPDGIYFVRLDAPSCQERRKVILAH